MGFEVDNFQGALRMLRDAGYPVAIGPIKAGNWHVAFVKDFEDIWLDIYHVSPKRERKPRPKRRAARRRR